MPIKTIDLDALERVVGCAPARYRDGDPRNTRRLLWWTRATHALEKVLLRAPLHLSSRSPRHTLRKKIVGGERS